jgi:prevent-host-death family protein
MQFSTQIQPVSYLKANAAQIMRDMAQDLRPVIITQNGKAAAVLQDVASFEQTQETLALLKILALGNAQIEAGKTKPAKEVFAKLRRSQTRK